MQVQLKDEKSIIGVEDKSIVVGEALRMLGSRKEIIFSFTRASAPPPPAAPTLDINSFLMGNAKANSNHVHLPDVIESPKDGIGEIFNELLEFLKAEAPGVGFDKMTAAGAGKKLLVELAEVFFKLTHFEKPIFDQHVSASIKPPEIFSRFCRFSGLARGTSNKKKIQRW